jgi:hypothetical protein
MPEPTPVQGSQPAERDTPAPATSPTDPTNASSALTERYVEVTLDHVPAPTRAAVEPPLRSAISEEIEYRYDRLLGDENVTREDVEVEVLEDMGDPERVAATMTVQPQYLIGPRFFLDYKRVALWLIVVTGLAAAALWALSRAHEGASAAWTVVGAGVAAVTAALYALAWTTISFALAERSARPSAKLASAAWTIDRLPLPRHSHITASQTATPVVASLVLAVAIIWQQRFPSIYTAQGEGVTFLNPEHWPWVWAPVVVLLALVAMAAIFRHVHDHWTLTSAAVNLLLVGATAALLVCALLDHTFVNDAFFSEVGWPTDQLPTATLETWAAGVVAVVGLADIVVGFLRVRSGRAVQAD